MKYNRDVKSARSHLSKADLSQTELRPTCLLKVGLAGDFND